MVKPKATTGLSPIDRPRNRRHAGAGARSAGPGSCAAAPGPAGLPPTSPRPAPVLRRRHEKWAGVVRWLGLGVGRHLLPSRCPLEEQRGANRAGLCSATAGPAPASVYTVTSVKIAASRTRSTRSILIVLVAE
jgi:hypothetical protein